MGASREDLGLPACWHRVKSWLNFRGNVKVSGPGMTGIKKSKWQDIPVLADYSKAPDPSFWSKFPVKKLPERPETSIDTVKLAERVKKYMHLMTKHQIERSLKAVEYLNERIFFSISVQCYSQRPGQGSLLPHGGHHRPSGQ